MIRDHMEIAAGTRLGPYELIAPLGAGGMGVVYRARDVRLGREVAVKVLPESFVGDAEALARFEREARAVAAPSHPNILALHGYGREGGVAYAVMELLEGRDASRSDGPGRPARGAVLARSRREARAQRSDPSRRQALIPVHDRAPSARSGGSRPITGGCVGLP